MNKKVLVLLGLIAAIIILLVFHFFFSGSPTSKGPGQPQEPAKKSVTAPESKEKPGPTAPAAPAPQAQPQPTPPPEKPVTKPEPAPPTPPETALPPLEPKEAYGVLAGSYRNYVDALKLLEKLQKQGKEVFIRRDKDKYQVWVGPFHTSKEAAETAKSLQGKTKISPKIEKIIIPVPK